MRIQLLLLRLLSLLAATTVKYNTNAQQSPAHYVPNFTPDVTHRTNFCELHAAVERGDVELRNALQGVSISVGFFGYQLNDDGIIDEDNPSIAIEFLDELATRAGFTFRENYGLVDPPRSNETWSDVLYSLTDVYDVAGDWWIESTTRLENNIIYPDGWYDANYIMVEQTGNDSEFDFASFAAPFTPGLWGLIALTTIVSGIVYYFLDYFDSRIKGRPMDMGLESSLFLTAFLFKGHYAHHPKSRSTRILVFSMAFFFFFVVACYTANLASFLVLKNRQIIINDVQDVIRNDLTFCVETGTPQEAFLQSFRIQPRHLIRTLSEGDVDFEGQAFLSLLEGQCDIVFTAKGTFDKFRRRKEYNPNCNLALVGRIQKILSSGFALGDSEQYCTSIARDVMHLHMLEMKDSGVYSLIWDNFLNKATTNSCSASRTGDGSDDEENYDSLGVANLSGMFALHAIALVIALSITLFNFCRQPSHKRKTMISELRRGMFGSTSLNRAVVFAASNRSTVFSFAKNDQTGASERDQQSQFSSKKRKGSNSSRKTSSEAAPKPKPAVLPEIQECPDEEEFVKEEIENSGPSRVAQTVVSMSQERNEDGKTRFEALMEKNEQQKVLIEQLLQKVQTLDERSQIMDSRIQNIEGKM